jgi:hypothetical protein
MPAKDRYHGIVAQSLIKDGWAITHDQFTIVLPERFLWIDLRAIKAAEQTAVLIEVKGLESASAVEALALAVGKYVLYRTALELSAIDEPLYLAVPVAAFDGILSETLGRHLIENLNIHLVVFEPEQMEIVQWIP